MKMKVVYLAGLKHKMKYTANMLKNLLAKWIANMQ